MSSWSRWNSWRYCGQYLNKYWWNFVRYMYVYARVCQCVQVCMCVCVRVCVPESTLNLNCQHNIFKNVESFIWHMAGIAKKRQQLTENNSVTGYESKHDWLTSSFLLVSPCLPACLAVFVSAHLSHKLCWTECDTRKIIKIKIENQIRKPKPTATAKAKCILEKPHPLLRFKIVADNREEELWAPHISACFQRQSGIAHHQISTSS